MAVFEDYARYYDLLYQDKEYLREVAFLCSILERLSAGARSILDVGCGTGLHDFELARRGYAVTGIDLSEAMLAAAEAKRNESPAEVARNLSFAPAHASRFDLGRRFDAVVSLFHVVGYLTTDRELDAAFARVGEHLAADGLYVFDFWHAPAVEASGPAAREREVEDEEIRVRRVTTPEWRPERSLVDVHFDFTVTDKRTAETRQFSEVHSVRYYDPVALTEMLAQHGFAVEETGEWPTGAALSADVFGAYIVARK